jgi:hypothetical protein
MTRKRLSSIALVTLLMLSMAAVFTVAPVMAAEPYIAIKPPHTVFMTPVVNNTFSVYVNVSSTVGFVGYQFYLYWNRTYINATGILETPPASFTFKAFSSLTWNFNASFGEYASSYMDSDLVEITGTYTVSRIDFKIIKVPKAPLEPDALIPLDLDDVNTFLSDDQGSMITPYYVYDGDVFLKALAAAPCTIYVDPPTYTATSIGEVFNIDVKIKDVVAEHHMWGWEFVMWYNTTLLDTLNVVEGDFLSNHAAGYPNASTFFIGKFGSDIDPSYVGVTYEDNELNRPEFIGEGKIHSAGLLYWENASEFVPPVGGGILATITFNATYEWVLGEEPEAWCYLDIGIGHGSTEVADTPELWPPMGEVPHNTEDGEYHAPMKVIGRSIDCYTDAYRKYGDYYTQYTGIGPMMNADAYCPQDLVILFAYVTYNEDPVQHKLVQFEIEPMDKMTGEPRELEGFPLHRVAMTNEEGIATISFRIPMPCDDYPRVLGGWRCYQSVDIACEKVEDIIWFEVAWVIEITKVIVDPDPVAKCNNAEVTIEYVNHALTPLPVYFTVVLYDHLMVPIGMEIIDKRDTMVPAGIWCHPYNDTETVSIHIPKWALVGGPTEEWPYPAAFANAYTDICSECGMPYCPEGFVTFAIIRGT